MWVIRCVRDDDTTRRLGDLLDRLGSGEERAGGLAFLGAPIEGSRGRRRVPVLIVTPEYVACVDLVTVDGHGELIAPANGQWSLGGAAVSRGAQGANPAARAMSLTQDVQRKLEKASIITTVFSLVLVAGHVTGVDQPDGSRPYELIVDQCDEVSLIAALNELGVYAQRTGGHRTAGASDVDAVVEALQLAAPMPDPLIVHDEGFAPAAGWCREGETLRVLYGPPELPVYDAFPEEQAALAKNGTALRTRPGATPSNRDQRPSLAAKLHPMVWIGLGLGLFSLVTSQTAWLFGLPGVVFSIGGLIGVVRRGGSFLHIGAGILGLAMSVAGLLNLG